MKQRVISGVFIVILALLILIPGGIVLGCSSFILSLIAYRELLNAIGTSGKANNDTKSGFKISSIEFLGYLDIAIYYSLMMVFEDRTWLLLSLFFGLITFMALYVFSYPKYTAKDIMMSFFSMCYGPMMLGFMYMTRQLEYGQYFVWLIFISSWVSDTFAYFSGSLLGRHKLAPNLSPKKSIEGAIGGVIGAALVGGLFTWFFIDSLIPGKSITLVFIVISAIGSVVAQIGDLAASAIKRNENIKDYGTLIPGHGGIMDRFDSVIFTAPMIYMLTIIFITVSAVV